MQIGTILVPTDFSDTSKIAFPAAAALAGRFDARLVVLYVEEDRLPPLVVEYTAVGLEELVQEQSQRSRKRLTTLVEDQFGSTEGLDLRVVVGTPHAEIVRLAEEVGADLIVMATHGRGFISHAILGSTTERVLRHAPCPVYVVREQRRSESPADRA